MGPCAGSVPLCAPCLWLAPLWPVSLTNLRPGDAAAWMRVNPIPQVYHRVARDPVSIAVNPGTPSPLRRKSTCSVSRFSAALVADAHRAAEEVHLQCEQFLGGSAC